MRHATQRGRLRPGLREPTHALSRPAADGNSGERAMDYSVRTKRNPMSSLRRSGGLLRRFADRSPRVYADLKLPPRRTRSEPVAGPRGSEAGPAGYHPYRSAVHSRTFPSMSYNPHRFACSSATGYVRRLLSELIELNQDHATSSSFP